MKSLVAKNAKQLDTCLKMLDGFDISGAYVKPVMNSKDKTTYYINVDTDEQTMAKIEKMYKHLIS